MSPGGHIPYRGEARPKYPRPRRQFRDLQAEKREATATILFIRFVAAMVFVAATFTFEPGADNTPAVIFILISIFIFSISFFVQSGVKTVNRFRPSHDVDISPKNNQEDKPEE